MNLAIALLKRHARAASAKVPAAEPDAATPAQRFVRAASDLAAAAKAADELLREDDEREAAKPLYDVVPGCPVRPQARDASWVPPCAAWRANRGPKRS